MGEVYLARDIRIGRDVALKVLSETLAADTDRQRRFVEEARAAGALTHPSIVAVYDVSFDGPVPFLVTELVEGVTLQDEIERGPLPLKRALEIAAQVADGLSAAHDIGLVHRDLKPANVMVTRDGRAKILDFGLAKVLGAAVPGGRSLTQTGVVVGTVPYMSPEQARSGVIDFRSDQFSLGILLYEMVTGVHPFRRDSGVQTLSAIIEDDPRPIRELKPSIPPPVAWIVERCLAKHAADRYAATSDAARDLATLRARLSEASGAMMTTGGRRQFARVGLALGLAATCVVALAIAINPAATTASAHRLVPMVVDAGYQGAPAWSPDGKSIAYIAQVDGTLQVFTRRVGALLAAPLTQSRFDCYDPFWSADGRRVFYHSQMQERQGLWSVSTGGGEPEPVLENVAHATLSPDGRSLVFFREGSEQGGQLTLWTASASGADPRHLALPGATVVGATDGWVRFSPDGSKVLVWSFGFLRTKDSQPVDTSRFWLIPWPDGAPKPVLGAVAARTRNAVMAFDFLDDSRHVVLSMPEPASFGRHLWIADTESDRFEVLLTSTMNESFPRLSPDGTRLAFTSEAVDFDLLSIPLDGGAARPLLATSRNELDPAWAPALAQYVFVTDQAGGMELRIRSADGEFDRPLVNAADFRGDATGDRTRTLGAPAFSPDGLRVAYQRLGDASGYRIWISAAAGGPPDQLAPVSPGNMFQDAPSWSPDGRWIAYLQGLPGGTWRVARTRVGVADSSQVITDRVRPLSRPEWSPDGRLILFDSMDGLAVIPPDGGSLRVISDDTWVAHTWAADSKSVYGLRESEPPGRHAMLIEIDVATGRQRVINADLGPIPPANQPVRGLTRAGGGTLVTSVARATSDIWVLDGFVTPGSAWSRIMGLFQRPAAGKR